jgi:hypothetical protein
MSTTNGRRRRRLAGGAGGLQRRRPLPIVLDVRDLPVAHLHHLEDQRLAPLPVVADPVHTDNGRALPWDKLLGAHAAIAGPQRCCLLLLLEDRPGLLRALSTWRPPPPNKTAFDAAPDSVWREQCRQRPRVPFIQSLVGCPEVFAECGHRPQYGSEASEPRRGRAEPCGSTAASAPPPARRCPASSARPARA